MNGFLLIDKPKGISSFNALKLINKRFMIQRSSGKLGHGGTLDPEASGLLVIAIGKATRLLRYFLGSSKRYTAEITFGAATDSDDAEGSVISTAPYSHITPQLLAETLALKFSGTISQVPPDFSAVHVDGKRAYKLARKGRQIDLPAREVTITSTAILSCGLPQNPTVSIDISCSGGTYIRSIARDLGTALNSAAHLTGLRRTESCHFSISQAHTLDDILAAGDLEKLLIPCQDAMTPFGRIDASNRSIYRLLRGLPVSFATPGDGIFTIMANVPDAPPVMVAILERRDGRDEYLRLFTPDSLAALKADIAQDK